MAGLRTGAIDFLLLHRVRYQGLFPPKVKWLGYEADHSPLSTGQPFLICLQGAVLNYGTTFTELHSVITRKL
jgi:hypothetical protein